MIYQFVCTLRDKSNGVIKISYGHHLWNQEDPSCIRKVSWKLTISTFVNFWATKKCDISICMYFARQIQWCGQNYLWTSSLVSRRSSMDTEKCDLSICLYFLIQIQWCDQNHLCTSFLESRRSSMDEERFLKDDQIYFCQLLSYKEVWYINLYVLCETNPMVWSKLLIHIIIGVKKILHGSGRVPEGWPDLLLSNFKLQRSVIYQLVCTFWYKSNGVIKITYAHHFWNQEEPLWKIYLCKLLSYK